MVVRAVIDDLSRFSFLFSNSLLLLHQFLSSLLVSQFHVSFNEFISSNKIPIGVFKFLVPSSLQMVSRVTLPLDLWVDITTKEMQETLSQIVENRKRLQKLYQRCIQSIDCQCDSCLDDCSRKKVTNCIRSVDCNCDSCLDDCLRKRKQVICVDITENTAQKVLDKCPQSDENGLEAAVASPVNSMLGPCQADIKTTVDSTLDVEALSRSLALLQIRRMAEMKDNMDAMMGEMESKTSVYLLSKESSLLLISKFTRNVLLKKKWKDLCVAQECLSRAKIVNTFSKIHGQIFIREINWTLKPLHWSFKFDFKDRGEKSQVVEKCAKTHRCLNSHAQPSSSLESLKLYDELVELGSTYISCLFPRLINVLTADFFPCGLKKQTDATIVVFDPGILVFDWGNQLKELLDGVISAASASILLFMCSFDYAKTPLDKDAKVANKWMVRRFNRPLDVYCRNIKSVAGELQDSYLACGLLGWGSINCVVTSIFLFVTTSRTSTILYGLMFYEQGNLCETIESTEHEFFNQLIILLSYKGGLNEILEYLDIEVPKGENTKLLNTKEIQNTLALSNSSYKVPINSNFSVLNVGVHSQSLYCVEKMRLVLLYQLSKFSGTKIAAIYKERIKKGKKCLFVNPIEENEIQSYYSRHVELQGLDQRRAPSPFDSSTGEGDDKLSNAATEAKCENFELGDQIKRCKMKLKSLLDLDGLLIEKYSIITKTSTFHAVSNSSKLNISSLVKCIGVKNVGLLPILENAEAAFLKFYLIDFLNSTNNVVLTMLQGESLKWLNLDRAIEKWLLVMFAQDIYLTTIQVGTSGTTRDTVKRLLETLHLVELFVLLQLYLFVSLYLLVTILQVLATQENKRGSLCLDHERHDPLGPVNFTGRPQNNLNVSSVFGWVGTSSIGLVYYPSVTKCKWWLNADSWVIMNEVIISLFKSVGVSLAETSTGASMTYIELQDGIMSSSFSYEGWSMQLERPSFSLLVHLFYCSWHWNFCGCSILPVASK